ncbi:hypothetical protein LCGC14_2229520 [marine sediment metagenome]|uniref:Uncharacterized protein n=1 Tax=marine sediment metagenome TaxID=412755 RepID=A0A0F9G3W1_9ZZZZ|nr:hypothetical protein [Candidatus Scalindua sp.]
MRALSTQGGVMEEVASRLNENYTTEEANYNSWFNMCTNDIARTFPNAPFNYVSADRTLSAGTRHYTNMPSDFEKMIDVTYPAGDVKLKNLSEEEFDALQPSATETGTPTVYVLHGASETADTQIEFFPVPNASITLNYKCRKLPATVSTFSAQLISVIPPKYNELYVLFVQKEGYYKREDTVQGDRRRAEYETMKQVMINDFKRLTEEPWRIKSIREFQAINKNYSDEIVNLFWGE